jgi:tRNA (pseudouridine54-N1)-methyltransferase
VRRFVVIGSRAVASGRFLYQDLPGTSGRLDVLLRCMRAALLVSHGVRHDAVAYLVLLGGYGAPRSLRVEGASVRYLRPDERSLATLVRKALEETTEGPGFVTVRPGVAVARGGLEAVLEDAGPCAWYLLDEGGEDLRETRLAEGPRAFLLGDHRGLDEATRARLAALGAGSLRVGPVSIHADDVVAVVSNELDRRGV